MAAKKYKMQLGQSRDLKRVGGGRLIAMPLADDGEGEGRHLHVVKCVYVECMGVMAAACC